MNCFLESLGKALCRPFYMHPIFVVGSGRSGTSVLLQALGRHPAIVAAPGEAPLLTYLSDAAYPLEYGDTRDFFLTSIQMKTENFYEGLRQLCIESCFGPSFGVAKVAPSRFREGIKLRPMRWAAKTFPSSKGYDSLRILFPDARFVFIVRNGIEVVHSMTKFHGFSDRQFEEQCRAWVKSYESFKYLMNKPDAFFVQHENLVADGAGVIGYLLNFLELEPSNKPIEFLKNTVIHPLNENTKKHTNAQKQLENRSKAFEAWNADQKSCFRELCGHTMLELGYTVPF